jgi:hypothetical protein
MGTRHKLSRCARRIEPCWPTAMVLTARTRTTNGGPNHGFAEEMESVVAQPEDVTSGGDAVGPTRRSDETLRHSRLHQASLKHSRTRTIPTLITGSQCGRRGCVTLCASGSHKQFTGHSFLSRVCQSSIRAATAPPFLFGASRATSKGRFSKRSL